MEIKDAIQEYYQPDGLIVPKNERPGPEGPDTTGNGIKYFCMYHVLLVDLGLSRPDDFASFEAVVKSCFLVTDQGILPILCRSPGKGRSELTAKDDYVWQALAAKVLKSRTGWQILDAGNRKRILWLKWFYKNTNPIDKFSIFSWDTWKSWRGMNPEVIAHMQWCSGVRPHPLRILWQAVAIAISSVNREDLVTNTYAMARAAEDQSWLISLGTAIWIVRRDARWPGGMKQVLSKELEPNQPVAQNWIRDVQGR